MSKKWLVSIYLFVCLSIDPSIHTSTYICAFLLLLTIWQTHCETVITYLNAWNKYKKKSSFLIFPRLGYLYHKQYHILVPRILFFSHCLIELQVDLEQDTVIMHVRKKFYRKAVKLKTPKRDSNKLLSPKAEYFCIPISFWCATGQYCILY